MGVFFVYGVFSVVTNWGQSTPSATAIAALTAALGGLKGPEGNKGDIMNTRENSGKQNPETGLDLSLAMISRQSSFRSAKSKSPVPRKSVHQ
jgi:hypothetical protein